MNRRFCLLASMCSMVLLAGCGRAKQETAAAVNTTEAAAVEAAPLVGETVGIAIVQTAENAPSQAKQKLRYRFEVGKGYSYKINVEADLGDKVLITNAGCNYSVDKPVKSARPKEPLMATGTAFVVHPDGYMLTCEHVVEGAQKVEVALGGKKYAAKVITADQALDLALIKIDARSLAALPLGNSSDVEVGQEVRAIGYPLSSVLGSSLKATRGSVSGIDQISGHKTFQIDAGVNGGNSGGPLVTEGGHVVGVVNAKLTGEEVSNVGFAVPVDYAKAMLSKGKVQFSAAKGREKLEGPALVKKVDPCVALVTVTISPDAAEDTYNLRATGHIARSERQKKFTPGQRPTFGAGNSNVFFGSRTPVEVKVDSAGGILDFNGADSLPFMLGYAPLFIFEPLPSDGRTQWDTRQQIMLEGKSEKADRDEPGFGFGPRGPIGPRGSFGPRGFSGPRFGPDARREEPAPRTKSYPALETVSYSIDSSDGDLVTIIKEYELKTTGNDTLQVQTTGTGTIAFDTKAGVPKKMEYQGAFSITQGLVSVKVPITASYELVDGKPAAVASTSSESPSAAAAAARAARRPAPSPAGEPEFAPVAGNSNLLVRVSGTERQNTPDRAFDGNLETNWGAGGWPVHWIEMDLRQSSPLTSIKLIVAQSPAGETEHEVWVSDKPLGAEKAGGKLAHTFRGATKPKDALEFEFLKGTTARYVQVRTTKSPSWVAWAEIDIQPAGK